MVVSASASAGGWVEGEIGRLVVVDVEGSQPAGHKHAGDLATHRSRTDQTQLQQSLPIEVRRRRTVGQQSSGDERVECPHQLGRRESGGSSRTVYSARGPRAVQQREQHAEACTAEDQRGVGIDPDLDLIRRALNDGRVRHEPRMRN